MDHHHAHHHQHSANGQDVHAGHDPMVFKRKFWVSLALTLPILIFSHPIQQLLGYDLVFPGSTLIAPLLGGAVFFYGGIVFLKGAIAELRSAQPGMMTLISMAITVAGGYSVLVSLGVVSGMDFWWELATLITIMLLGHWFEMASIARAQGALHELAKLLPDEAEVMRHGKSEHIPIKHLQVGDLVLVRPGGAIPADGVIQKGNAKVDEAMITGESKTVTKSVGSEVIGGTIATSGALTIKVTKVGDDTTLAGIMKLVYEAQQGRSTTQVLADKAAAMLTYVAVVAALVTWIGWWVAGASVGFIFERVVTVLVIACPHALGLAIPLVTSIATTLAAKNGLLLRSRLALETVRTVDVVIFDKTGTLTEGKQGVVGVVAANSSRILAIAHALEEESEHSIAKAIVDYASAQSVESMVAHDFQAHAGRGVTGIIDGNSVAVGGAQLLQDYRLGVPGAFKEAVMAAEARGQTVVYVIEDKKVIGAIFMADVIRPESKRAVQKLQAMGIRTAMLTGDSHAVASWVASELGMSEFFAQVLPENKASTVAKLQKDGSRVAMVGDGVNDAPALTQADVGIAIGAGTDVAIESAGIILASNDPCGVAKSIVLSRAAYRKMIQNLLWAAGYNVVAIPLAAGVTSGIGFILSPAVGAILMSISTIVVALNAQLLRRTKL